MAQDAAVSWFRTLKNVVIGRARNPFHPSTYHSLSIAAFLAWVGLGCDPMSSSCYGPEAMFLALGEHPHLGIFVALGAAFTVFVIGASYSEIVELFPTGGGGYLVASKLLTPTFGMISGCALLVDYVLTISISIASGSDALFSFLPEHMYGFKFEFALFGVVLMTLINLRGIRESVIPLVPIFLTFVLTHAFFIVYAVASHSANFGAIVSQTASDFHKTTASLGIMGTIVVMLRAYSLGAGTFTGLEAVSNGMPVLREPKVHTARKALMYMIVSLAILVVGLMVAYLLFNVHFQEGKTLNAVLLEEITARWNPKVGLGFLMITLFSEAAILFIAAQAGFIDGPRVLSNMAIDRWMPTRFAILSDRLVTQNGILIMGLAAFLMVLLTHGSVMFLVVLYSINVFITFSLSQIGMVRHWWSERTAKKPYKLKLAVSATAMVLCIFILIAVTALKFEEGGWITLVITGTLILLVTLVKRHYNRTAEMLRQLDARVMSILSKSSDMKPDAEPQPAPAFNPAGKTAILLVNGFNGLGLHTLFNVNRFFGNVFKNFIFLEVGVLDAGNFKGTAEVEHLKDHSTSEVHKYVDLMNRNGFWAQAYSSVSTDVVEEIVNKGQEILGSFPNAIFFGGQLMFRREMVFGRWLHNNIVFAVQRRFYYQGIPIVILPIRVY